MRWVSLSLIFLVACGGEGPSLEVLEQGKSPRHLLRYAVQEGVNHEVLLSMNMRMESMPSVDLDVTMDLNVIKVTPEGDITYEFRFSDIESNRGSLPGMDDILGMSGSIVIDSRGVHKGGNVHLGENAPKQLQQMMMKLEESMQQMSCPFPKEAVGVGAKWKVRQTIKTPAFSLAQSTTFELVEFDGHTGLLKVSIEQTAGNEQMKLPNGMTVDLIKLRSKGNGEIEFDLSKPHPVSSYVNMTTDVTVGMKGRKASSTIGIRVEVGEK